MREVRAKPRNVAGWLYSGNSKIVGALCRCSLRGSDGDCIRIKGVCRYVYAIPNWKKRVESSDERRVPMEQS